MHSIHQLGVSFRYPIQCAWPDFVFHSKNVLQPGVGDIQHSAYNVCGFRFRAADHMTIRFLNLFGSARIDELVRGT